MEEKPISFLLILFSVGFSLLIVSAIVIKDLAAQPTKIVFCSVGQGDASYIRIKNKFDILVDTGPDRKVLDCLGKHMPFYDRNIELLIITHPQKDHYFGSLYLLERYSIKKVLMTPIDSENNSFIQLKEKLVYKNISIHFPTNKTRIKVLDDEILFYWPSKDFLEKNLVFDSINLSYKNNLQLGKTKLDPNDFSLVFLFKEKQNKVLFTGDIPIRILDKLFTTNDTITILKVSHHGSKKGLSSDFLRLANPMFSVISVGKNNRYNHPSDQVINILKALKKEYMRTDIDGDIVFRIK